MQAHPLSSPAARITSTPHRTQSNTSQQPALPAPTPIRLLRTNSSVPRPDSPPPSLADTVGLAHDAGNLLAALGLYCDLLRVPGVLRPEHQHYATELSLISDRSSALIQRLLRTSAGMPPASSLAAKPSVSDPHEAPASDAANHASILRNLAPVLQNIAAGAAQVSVTCPTTLPPLDFTSDILERITVNLVRNAAEALRIQRKRTDSPISPHQGEIRVSLAIDGRQLLLTVEDNGPGMYPATAAKFLHPSPLPPHATHGLGHRIIRELATATDGQLSIRVLPGSGTVFSILWPIPASLRHDSPGLDASQPRSSSIHSFPSPQPLDKEQARANA